MARHNRHGCIWESIYGRPNEYCRLFGFDCARCEFYSNQCRNGQEKARSFELPASYWLSREHLWIAPGPDRTGLVGIDHFLSESLRHVRSIIRPCPNTRLQAGKHCVWLFDILGTISLRAPVGGVVVRSNWDLVRQPILILTHPYGLGWLLEVRMDGFWQEGLLKGAKANAFIQRSRDMLQDKVVSVQAKSATGMVATDGGRLALDSILRTMPDTYLRFLAETIAAGRVMST